MMAVRYSELDDKLIPFDTFAPIASYEALQVPRDIKRTFIDDPDQITNIMYDELYDADVIAIDVQWKSRRCSNTKS